MTDPIRAVGGLEPLDRREGERRERERRKAILQDAPDTAADRPDGDAAAGAKSPARAAVLPAPEPGAAAFVAQQMGQSGQKRGLRGGAPVLDAARSAYLETEYSGAAERRPRAGRTTRTEI
nr:hypothetical protein [uncultured Brevundimonas sp.]